MAKATAEQSVTPEELQELLSYDPETGTLTWKNRGDRFCQSDRSQKIFQSVFAGKPALVTKNQDGYLWGQIFGKSLMAHRAAFCLMSGHWPVDQIDHVNGIRDDNRWENLREASRKENHRNRKASKSSTSSFVGVSFRRDKGLWSAFICIDKKKKHLGYFGTEEEAAKARDSSARGAYGDYARLNFP